MTRTGLVLVLAALAVPAAGGGTRQETGPIVFASDRTVTLIPMEARSIELRTGRSRRLGVVPDTVQRRVIWAPAAQAIAYVTDRGDLYVVRPGGRRRLIARHLGATDDRPRWSRSGRRIAFFGRDRGRLSVYVVRAQGGGLKRVARRIADAPDVLRGQALEWSPDDRRLAIVASRGGRYRLVVVEVRTGQLRRLRTGRGRPADPSWSPDGRELAFRAQVPGEQATVRTIDVETGRVRRVHYGNGVPLWSPDGRSLAIHEKHRLWVIQDGASARLVATHSPISNPPVWSPDSRRLAFLDRSHLVIAEARRKRTSRLTRERHLFYPASAPAWSASGHIVYVAFRKDPGDLDLHVIRDDGTGVRALTKNGVWESEPAWSPDGRRIAYSRARGRTSSDVYLMNADGSAQRRVVADARAPSWSPDGARLAFERGGDIWTVGLDGSNSAQLTSGPERDDQPAWSPSGGEIAFSRDPDPGTAELFAVQVATRVLRRITAESSRNVGCHGHWARAPAWSPDGRSIAYEVERGGSPTCNPSRGHHVSIHVIEGDGTDRRFVTDGGYVDATSDDGALSPTWSPDGAQIAFVSSVHDLEPEYEGRNRIGLVAASGGAFRLITPKSYFARSPSWGG